MENSHRRVQAGQDAPEHNWTKFQLEDCSQVDFTECNGRAPMRW